MEVDQGGFKQEEDLGDFSGEEDMKNEEYSTGLKQNLAFCPFTLLLILLEISQTALPFLYTFPRT